MSHTTRFLPDFLAPTRWLHLIRLAVVLFATLQPLNAAASSNASLTPAAPPDLYVASWGLLPDGRTRVAGVYGPRQNPCNESVRLNPQGGSACDVVFRVQHLDGLRLRDCGDKQGRPVRVERHGRPWAQCRTQAGYLEGCPDVLQLYACDASNSTATAMTTATGSSPLPTGSARSAAAPSLGRTSGASVALAVTFLAVGIVSWRV